MGRGVMRISPASSLTSSKLGRLRQAVYRLFGALFLYPDVDRLAKLRAAAGELQQEWDLWGEVAFFSPLRRLLEVLAELNEETIGQIEEEYVRLFLVKPAAPFYQSFYMDPAGHARGLIVSQLEREYAEAGLALSPTLKDLPDHIAVELEFMSFLCGEEVRAWEAKDVGGSSQARERQRAFLGQHLGRWFPQFSSRVGETDPERLYALLVEATYAFLRHELDLLQLSTNGK
jgi:TorA maturation chaperone TorD